LTLGAYPRSGTRRARALPRAAVWLVWTVSGVGVALGVLALVYGGLNHSSLTEVLTSVAPQTVWAMSFPLVGAVIATHRPRNPLGWMFLVIGLSQGLTSFGHEYAS
jgi:two-component system, NarL family, sensor kinase